MSTFSVTKSKSGNITGYNIQWYEGKDRRTVSLSSRQYSRKVAERFKDGIETLLYYRRNGINILDKSTENWFASLSDELQSKLAKVGLVTLTESKTCQELWDSFLKYRAHLKLSTLQSYQHCRKHFFRAFMPTEPIEAITPDRLLEWKQSLLTKYAQAGVACQLKTVKSVFGWAVTQEWLPKNPMQGIPRGSFVNPDNDRIISMEEYGKLLEACPDQEWRTIIALARIGGLRCPSELKGLRWSDIDRAKKRFLVRSPKTEQYAGHRERLVPLFPELRAELEQHFLAVEPKDDDFVIQRYKGTAGRWNVWAPFQAIAHKAGLGTIIRPFDNMRMSRSNEILRRFGETKENAWLGHTSRVMRAHYFQLVDEDFTEASGEN